MVITETGKRREKRGANPVVVAAETAISAPPPPGGPMGLEQPAEPLSMRLDRAEQGCTEALEGMPPDQDAPNRDAP